ncbi:MAG: signal peptidase I [Deltaproteobacteria bacterium RIFOXYD12_FULL_50_9]|nr:MAG: signal peptidase I [Deltaproteobacteria bacterium RIFOXYD12_FULL_50_9]
MRWFGNRPLSAEKHQATKKSVLREYIEAIVIALLLAMFIRTFIVQAFKIPSGSMIPTLLVGDHILVNKFLYGVRNPFSGAVWLAMGTPERGDVVVFKYPLNPAQDFIKRVIGVAGDKIEIIDKKLYVNNALFEVRNALFLDPKIIPGERDNLGPLTVPPNSLFVMGDNRDNSHDSRFWKFVPMKDIKGKAFMLYWSWDGDAMSVRWRRIGGLIK